jgi:hypothetical protein
VWSTLADANRLPSKFHFTLCTYNGCSEQKIARERERSRIRERKRERERERDCVSNINTRTRARERKEEIKSNVKAVK